MNPVLAPKHWHALKGVVETLRGISMETGRVIVLSTAKNKRPVEDPMMIDTDLYPSPSRTPIKGLQKLGKLESIPGLRERGERPDGLEVERGEGHVTLYLNHREVVTVLGSRLQTRPWVSCLIDWDVFRKERP